MVFVLDSYYSKSMGDAWMKEIYLLPLYVVVIRDNEDFFPPKTRLQKILNESKKAGCNAYVILVANGLQVSRLLQFAEGSGEQPVKERLDLNVLHYPAHGRKTLPTTHIDTWHHGKFRYGRNHFPDKTRDLRGKLLRVAVFEHVPAVTKQARQFFQGENNNIQETPNSSEALGIEFEILRVIAKVMNFKASLYTPPNVDKERWGSPGPNDTYTGLLGEAVASRAAFFLGDLHYTLRHYRLLDLSLPYNTECLTFLTPESLMDNSWKLLIAPFKLYTWIAVILTLLSGGIIFHLFSLSYERYIIHFKRMKTSLEKNLENFEVPKSAKTGKQSIKSPASFISDDKKGLYLFTELQNSILYTYSMLLLVSLPRLPNAWALRVFIGWWWLYSILVVVSYRASMTAVLANSVDRITIDTIVQLAKSPIAVGGWGEDKKELFLTSNDVYAQKVGSKFELVTDEEEALSRVANGTFGYYENIYHLKQARTKRQILNDEQKKNASSRNEAHHLDRILHIMQECVVHMPISVGLDKHSPLKPRVDKLIQRMVETGLIQKWLNEVLQSSKTEETQEGTETQKMLVDLQNLYIGFVILAVGYFFSLFALISELLHWKYIVQKNPTFDKYYLDVFYKKQ
ncbi:ionotropic receptor 21a-like isoform X2 [Orussus abietinus]|uniref:ionotropic receptor 21a-like isoform X2 n=1 Tax=Orussus abietinus TaxID=222816 RepID=UPI000C715BD1|nr:ionotropic receptor 21a-like isoform X2 [Orussus abietinus]